MRRCLLIRLFLIFTFCVSLPGMQSRLLAQKQIVDSLQARMREAQHDTDRVGLYWRMADAMYIYNPDSAIMLAGEGLRLSRQIAFVEGESRSLGIMANALSRMGNYAKALEYYLVKLRIEESRKNPRGLAGVLMNIGINYVSQEDYTKALAYYRQSDSIIQARDIDEFRYNIALNIGDLFEKTGQLDSARYYYRLSLTMAEQDQDADLIGASRIGMGNIYARQGNTDSALYHYKRSIYYLQEANDEDLICESALGLARVWDAAHRPDSAVAAIHFGLAYAVKDRFLSREFDLVRYLSDIYHRQNRIDSAFHYLNRVESLRDSLESKDRIRAAQQLTFNEQIRQIELAEKALKEKEERRQQIQLILIGMFIPTLFFITVLLTRIRIPLRLVKFLGVISLLFFFEYLTLLLHPIVVEITHHTPILEILIFVILAAGLIPTHHRIEHWVIETLVHRVQKNKEEPLAKPATTEAAKPAKAHSPKPAQQNKRRK